MKYYLIISALVICIFQSCKPAVSTANDEAQLRAMLATERTAHFNRDVELFVKEFSDSMISVNKGTIKATPPDTMRKSIGRYFDAVQFVKWDDMAPPVIRFSNDGSLAYALVQKEVIVNYPGSSGLLVYDTTHYAWVSVYRKQEGSWKVEANISTNK